MLGLDSVRLMLLACSWFPRGTAIRRFPQLNIFLLFAISPPYTSYPSSGSGTCQVSTRSISFSLAPAQPYSKKRPAAESLPLQNNFLTTTALSLVAQLIPLKGAFHMLNVSSMLYECYHDQAPHTSARVRDTIRRNK